MSRRVVLLPPAVHDLARAIRWLELLRPGVGEILRDEVDTICERILGYPELYALYRRDYRRAVLHRFDYSLIYRQRGETIEVVALLHTRLSPLVTQTRTNK